MKEKYKEHLIIDEKHMMQTIEITKKMIEKREVKYEENKMNTWKEFFRFESLKYCVMAFISMILLILMAPHVYNSGYVLCCLNTGMIGLFAMVDMFQSDRIGMEELLRTVKINPSHIFIYKSNIYLIWNLVSSLIFNFIVVSIDQNLDYMMAVFYSLVPPYLVSGLLLLIVDHVKNKSWIILIYGATMVLSLMMVNWMIRFIDIPSFIILPILMISFTVYCVGTGYHVYRMEKGVLSWN